MAAIGYTMEQIAENEVEFCNAYLDIEQERQELKLKLKALKEAAALKCVNVKGCIRQIKEIARRKKMNKDEIEDQERIAEIFDKNEALRNRIVEIYGEAKKRSWEL